MGGRKWGRFMKPIETERLILRHQTMEDAAFILELVNDPSWLQFIGDRGVRTLEDARGYIAKGALEMYGRVGFGFYLTELKDSHVPVGICGLVKRESLEDVDLGFAFLPAFCGRGYAFEAASAVVGYARSVLGLKRLAAITTADNNASARLLKKLGMKEEGIIPFAGKEEEMHLYGLDL
jgi:RimJ/RimL family protein N-acetyltransferase